MFRRGREEAIRNHSMDIKPTPHLSRHHAPRETRSLLLEQYYVLPVLAYVVKETQFLLAVSQTSVLSGRH